MEDKWINIQRFCVTLNGLNSFVYAIITHMFYDARLKSE